MRRPRIAVIGSYNEGLVMKTDRLPVWGETVIGNGFSEGPGGKGSNQAVAAARLGAEVVFIGCVGDDFFGAGASAMLRSEGVDISFMRKTSSAKTGVGFVILNRHGENCILVDAGANHELSRQDIDDARKPLEHADIVLVQLEIRTEITEYAMATARRMGKTVILNPAPAKPGLEPLLKYATIVTPNDSELKILCGIDPSLELDEGQCAGLAASLLPHGPEAVIVTRGEKGALLIERGRVLSIPPPKVEPVDTTGAGDSFSAALAVALGEGAAIDEAVNFACHAGAYTVTGAEVIPALPDRTSLERFIRECRQGSPEAGDG